MAAEGVVAAAAPLVIAHLKHLAGERERIHLERPIPMRQRVGHRLGTRHRALRIRMRRMGAKRLHGTRRRVPQIHMRQKAGVLPPGTRHRVPRTLTPAAMLQQERVVLGVGRRQNQPVHGAMVQVQVGVVRRHSGIKLM